MVADISIFMTAIKLDKRYYQKYKLFGIYRIYLHFLVLCIFEKMLKKLESCFSTYI